jgi:hypothetical protein
MDIRMSHIVIWPISLVHGSTIIYITSQVVNKDSIINTMLSLRKPNTGQLCYSSKVYSTQCPRCKINNFKDCEHDVFMPRYFDKERTVMVHLLMRNNPQIFQQEIRNEYVQDELRSCFDSVHTHQLLKSNNEYNQKTQHEFVYVVVDPSAGGKNSRYAIISFVTDRIKIPNSSETRMCLIVCIYYFHYLCKRNVKHYSFILPIILNHITLSIMHLKVILSV